jgi:hypothetical protein
MMSFYFLLCYIFLAWRCVFHDPEQFPKATIIRKIIHSVAIFFLMWTCWNWVFTMTWIVLHPHQWVEYLIHKPKPYPVALDATFQLLGSVVGPVGTVCCYFTLRGYEKARRVLLLLLPLIYFMGLYGSLAKFIQVHNVPSLPVFALGALFGSVPFLFVFVFYRHPKVIKAFFITDNNHSRQT